MKISIYLSGPIDNCDDEDIRSWRIQCKQCYPQYIFGDPLSHEVDYLRGKLTMDQVIDQEKEDILHSDYVLCYPWKASSGTAMEVMFAYMNNIPVLTISKKGQYLSEWIRHHSTKVFDNPQEAFTYISEVTSK